MEKNEDKILLGMTDFLGFNFKTNIIDVHIVSGNPRNFSSPVVIKSGHDPVEFVDVLTHELIHVLLQYNNDIASWECVEWIKGIYPNETKCTQDHLIVQAVLKYIYLDILKEPIRLQKNIVRSQEASMRDYEKAWEIVEKLDYMKFIKEYKKHYEENIVLKTLRRRGVLLSNL